VQKNVYGQKEVESFLLQQALGIPGSQYKVQVPRVCISALLIITFSYVEVMISTLISTVEYSYKPEVTLLVTFINKSLELYILLQDEICSYLSSCLMRLAAIYLLVL